MVDGGLAAVLENCVRKEVQRASMLPMVTTKLSQKSHMFLNWKRANSGEEWWKSTMRKVAVSCRLSTE